MSAEANASGLALVEKYYQDYYCRGVELKSESKKCA